MAEFSLGSDAFQHEQPIPEKYGCKGENIIVIPIKFRTLE
jgi:phosphatidylethanolamine-binding protein (PEBP) family uncharacterized protein